MGTPNETSPSFPIGSTAVRRDVHNGKIWTAAPNRVLQDSDDQLVLCCWPGARMLAPTTWTTWLRTGDDASRKQAIPNLAAGRWDLEEWTWRDTTLLLQYSPGDYFSVLRFFDARERCGGWYVNFEVPYRRTRIGIDTFDLLLDLVVEPDLTGHVWKDEDEYAQARRLGVIDEALHRHIDEARQRVVVQIGSREGPFAHDWSTWRRDPLWPLPELPADAMAVGAAPRTGTR